MRTEIAIGPGALWTLLSWMSPAWPVGAYAYSHGLEAAIAGGDVHDAASLQAWLLTVLEDGALRDDAILLSLTMRGGDAAALAELAEALGASAGRHCETMETGRAFAACAAGVHGLPPLAGPYPVVVGTAARALDLPAEATVAGYLHAALSNLVSVAVRFVPLGQTAGQRVLAALEPRAVAVAAVAATAAEDDLGTACVGADLAAIAQETLRTRIYRT